MKAVSSGRRALARADAPIAGHVGIVTSGGSGNLPLFLGYVGQGLCTAVAVGNRAQGHPDPGAVVYLRFLEALQRSFDRMGS